MWTLRDLFIALIPGYKEKFEEEKKQKALDAYRVAYSQKLADGKITDSGYTLEDMFRRSKPTFADALNKDSEMLRSKNHPMFEPKFEIVS